MSGEWKPPQAIPDALCELLAARPETVRAAGAPSVFVLCDLFLDYSHTHHDPENYRQYNQYKL